MGYYSMHISERGLALLKTFEGFCATEYICPAGKPTIGYGHVIGADEDFSDGISESQAELMLIADVSVAERAVNRLAQVTLNQSQFDALVVLTYNIGVGAFENSTLLRLLNAADAQGAAAQFSHWVYGGGKVLPGLVARRAAEEGLFTKV